VAQAQEAQVRADAAQTEAEEARTQAEQAAAAAAAANQEAARNAETAGQLQTNLEAASAMLQRLSWVTIGSSILAVAALGLAIFVLSSKDRRKRATEVITGTVKAVTEPFARSNRKGGGGAATSRAKLNLVDGGGATNLPQSIPLFGSSLRIGRDPSLVNVVIDDRRISRLHCRIMEEGGQFKVLDEGSTSGTYVNEAEVGINGQVLQPHDMLGIGPINYRFDVDGAQPKPTNGTFENNKIFDHTEPYVKPPGR
jgi:predicted component of type VI protein secretion system